MRNNIFTLIIGAIVLPGFLFSHLPIPMQEFDLHQKYFILRNRFREKFVLLESCDRGFGLPMNFRIGDNGSQLIDKLDWADGGIMLGQYISALALEYKLLSDNQQPTATTVEELYFSLNALYRIDASSGDYSYDNDLWSPYYVTPYSMVYTSPEIGGFWSSLDTQIGISGHGWGEVQTLPGDVERPQHDEVFRLEAQDFCRNPILKTNRLAA